DEARTRPITIVRGAELDGNGNRWGINGSPTWVKEIRAIESPKATCTFIDTADARRAAEQTIAELGKLGALDQQAPTRRQIGAAIRQSARGRDFWVACETGLDGKVTRGTLELLSAGDQLASRLGGALVAVGFPGSIARHAEVLESYGADRVLVLD